MNLDAIAPKNVTLELIAHNLSNICRFAGATEHFYCVTPDTRVLTQSLDWVRAGSLTIDQALIGFDEDCPQGPRTRRKLRPSRVTHTGTIFRPVYRLVLSDGSVLRSSADHPWLTATKRSGNQNWETTENIARAVKQQRKRWLKRYLHPWVAADTYDAGYIAGIMDGEGHISVRKNGNRSDLGTVASLGFDQNSGTVLSTMLALLEKHGFDVACRKNPASRTMNALILGKWSERLRFLGTFRPKRLIERFERIFESGNYNREFPCSGLVEIVDASFQGEQQVIALETTSYTYFAEGFCAHNSIAQHSLYVSMLVPQRLAFAALLHDSEEMFVTDLPTPIKCAPEMEWYRDLGKHVRAQIYKAFNVTLSDEDQRLIKEAHDIMLATEAEQLLPRSSSLWHKKIARPAPFPITPLLPKTAKHLWLTRARERQYGPILTDETEHHVASHG